ncbi:MAG TPA: hypothetical protein VMS37_19310 [Verrucomicrobiae bacterium]|nr:hypothetical protein [Verrucomicrobiae bacterium]
MMANRHVLLLPFLVAFPLPSPGQIQVLAVTSSANFAVGRLLPGSLASLFCTGIQNVGGVVIAPGFPLPHILAGARVAVNGTEAPILAIADLAGGSYQQINVQVPWEATTASGLDFEVSQLGASAHSTAYPQDPWPVFFVDSSGYAVAQHAGDYRLVTRSDPARPGEWVVVYATNLGSVQNPPADGYPAPLTVDPIVPDTSPYASYFGLAVGPSADYTSTRLQSNYIGLAPGSIIYQVNLLVPGSQPAGDLVFQVVNIYNCGFFFIPGCGRGLTTQAASMPARIPVGI